MEELFISSLEFDGSGRCCVVRLSNGMQLGGLDFAKCETEDTRWIRYTLSGVIDPEGNE